MKNLTAIENQQFHLGTLVLRIIGGGLMLAHGIPKLLKLFRGDFQFADPIGLGPGISLGLTVFAEFLCAVFILIGFKSKLASVPLMITMLVAGLIVHGADPFGKKELALIYFGIYLAIFMLGSGKYSIDKMLQNA